MEKRTAATAAPLQLVVITWNFAFENDSVQHALGRV